MNILLIYPRFKYRNSAGIFAPLGPLYIAAAAREHGHKVSLIDMTFQDRLEIPKSRLKGVDAVGVSFSTPLAGRAYESLKLIKKMKPGLKCIAGGPHPTLSAEECLRQGFDVVVLGEGEQTFVELLEKMGSAGGLQTVKGIAFLKKDRVFFTAPRPAIANLDKLPIPARDLVDWEAYSKVDPTVIAVTGRGCPYHCLFCQPTQQRLFGKKVRRRTPANVVDEMEKGIGQDKLIYFVDDTFLYSKQWIMSFCREIEKRGLKFRWWCQGRVDNIEEELLEAIKKAGCTGLAMGVESGSQKILDFFRKGIKIKDIVRAFDLGNKAGMHTHAYVIVGSPMETKKDLEATVNLVKRIKPKSIAISTLTPVLGSDLYELAEKQGFLHVFSFDLMEYHSSIYPLRLKYLSRDDLDRYVKRMNNIVKTGG